MNLPCLFIKESSDKGRGVFTDEALAIDTIVEVAPVIVMPKADREHLDKTVLHDYIFIWGENEDQCCMALGMIPIYNHSYNSNCDYFMDFEAQTIMIKTVKAIAIGEELLINYNGAWDDKTALWFDAK
jgi:uncharacterized protein